METARAYGVDGFNASALRFAAMHASGDERRKILTQAQKGKRQLIQGGYAAAYPELREDDSPAAALVTLPKGT